MADEANDQSKNTGFKVVDGAVVATGDGSQTMSKADYDSWDWKTIKAAIHGVAGGHGKKAVHELDGKSDPSTLWNAALTFQEARVVLTMVGNSIRDQAEALAGEGRPWQGEAATAFLGLMTPFSKAFLQQAEQIAGGPSGMDPVPEQLWSAGNYLEWARRTVHDIDVHYAAETRRIAAETQAHHYGIDITLENNKTKVSEFPLVVEQMTKDMRSVLKTLAGNYQEKRFDTELQKVPTPDPLGSGPGGPNKLGLDNLPPELRNGPPLSPAVAIKPPSEVNSPPLSPAFAIKPPGGKGPGEHAAGDFTASAPPSFHASSPPGGGGIGNRAPNEFTPKSVPGSGGAGPNAPGHSGSMPPLSPTLAHIPGGPESAPKSVPGGSALKPPVHNNAVAPPLPFLPTPPPGSAGGPRSPGSSTTSPRSPGAATPPPKLPGSDVPNRFQPTPPPGGVKPPSLPDLHKPPAPDLHKWTGDKPPGGQNLPNPKDWAAGNHPDAPKLSDRREATVPPPMPFHPGSGPGAGGLPGGSHVDRPGSHGPIGDGKSWQSPKMPGLGDPQIPHNPQKDWVAPGASKPNSPGMPMMPPPGMPMAPGGGAPGGAGGGDRSDSSGLIGGEVKPWKGKGLPGLGDPRGPGEVAKGDVQDWAAGPGAKSPNPAGMPMMPPPGAPMAPGGGAPGGAQGGDRSDSSGLIGGEVKPWKGAEAPGLGDPRGVDTPAAVGKERVVAPSVSLPNPPEMPMMPPAAPMAPGGAPGGGAPKSERSDSSGLIGGEVKPWKGPGAPGLGDPRGVDTPAVVGKERVVAPGLSLPNPPGVPTMPPGAPVAPGGGAPSAEIKPWKGAEAPGLGGPRGVEMPAVVGTERAAAPGGASANSAGAPMMPPPGAPGGAAGGASGGDRSDSSGLIGGEVKPWTAPEAPGLGDPRGVDTPPATGQDWAAGPGAKSPDSAGMPMMPPPGMPMAPAGASNSERSDASGLIGGEVKPWEAPEVAGLGDPHGVDTPAGTTAEWAVAAVTPEEERIAVVAPAENEEDTSSWDLPLAGSLFGLGGLAGQRAEEPEAPEYTVREDTAWAHSGVSASARAVRAPESDRPVDPALFLPRPFEPDEQGTCSEEDASVEEVQPEQTEEETPERTAADLLRRDSSAWGAPKAAAPGVIG
ncbi:MULTISPECIES: hypothetical protein [unclassified Crossiella]|uniref:hypothetical protein n=1 Tax=unclassified Crossiella TaxID=2620835 RepID=UPI001FFE7893|nr:MULTISPECIES: hypothetical protein [unclassified Crossiella]MCK2244231.1 hypothetical protein [Crossiella sp. S99.2]MCK2258035.1 hypothetical protein [Crossiella sp. S99.1]